MIKFIGLRSSHVNRMINEKDTSKAIAKETKNPVEEREGVIELAKNARKSYFSKYSYIRGKNKAIKSDDIKPSLNKLKVTDEEYKKFFSCFYDVKAEKNGIITYSYTNTMQQTSEFYFKIAKEFAGKIGDEPKCDGRKDNWAEINTIAYRLALSFAEKKSCQEGKCKMEDIIRSRIDNPPPEVTNNKEYKKEQEKKLNIAKNFHLFKSSNIKLPELEDGKKYTEEQLIGIRKDIDKLKSASHGAFETLSQEYKPSPSLINNTNFSNIIIQSKSETRELEIDQAFANKIVLFLDSLKAENFDISHGRLNYGYDKGILNSLNSSDLFEIAKYFAAKVGGEPKENSQIGVGINTYLSRVATHLLEEKLVTENKADQVDIYSARIKQPPIELTETQRKEYTNHVHAKLEEAAGGGRGRGPGPVEDTIVVQGREIIRKKFQDYVNENDVENPFKSLLSIFEIDQDIDDKLKSINSADIVKVKAFLEKDISELSKALREYILNHPDNPFDNNNLFELKKSSAIGVLNQHGNNIYQHDLKTCDLAYNLLNKDNSTNKHNVLLENYQNERNEVLSEISKNEKNHNALLDGLEVSKDFLKNLGLSSFYDTISSLQIGIVCFFNVDHTANRKFTPDSNPSMTKVQKLKKAVVMETHYV